MLLSIAIAAGESTSAVFILMAYKFTLTTLLYCRFLWRGLLPVACDCCHLVPASLEGVRGGHDPGEPLHLCEGDVPPLKLPVYVLLQGWGQEGHEGGDT